MTDKARLVLLPEQIEALAHRRAWKYMYSSDPSHSRTYTFNRTCLLDFVADLFVAAAPSLPEPDTAGSREAFEQWWKSLGTDVTDFSRRLDYPHLYANCNLHHASIGWQAREAWMQAQAAVSKEQYILDMRAHYEAGQAAGYASADATNAELQAQLPEGMKHCTIVLKECEKGHGTLTATNWVQHECQTCAIERMQARNAELLDALLTAHDHIEMWALEISHCKDAAKIRAALTLTDPLQALADQAQELGLYK